MNFKQFTCLAFSLLTVIEVQCSTSEQQSIQVVNNHNSSKKATQHAFNRTFEIDYERNTFLMDGQPFRYVSGSFHYFRCPHQYWRDRLKTLKAAGLNAITTYVEWSFHEPEYREYKWSGDKNLVKFIEMAQEEELYVILRPGPYICAERDNGGIPYWLLTRYPKIKLRTSDEDYKSEVRGWYTQLMTKMQPFFYGNGGPIIMVQVENEYGSFKACDRRYMAWLADLTENWVRGSALLFTTDGMSYSALSCGSTPGVYATVDFGTGNDFNAAWRVMRMFSPKGPLVNSEYYTGWLTHWGENAISVSTAKVVLGMEKMFASNASFSFYMFYGGTNFGFTAGANLSPAYVADITSYDYDAPLTEAGDVTPKYMEIRKSIARHMPIPNIPIPSPHSKGSNGVHRLHPILSLLEPEGRRRLATKVKFNEVPLSFEALGQYSGFVLYEATIASKRSDPSLLTINDLRDRALIYSDKGLVGVLSRSMNIKSLPIITAQGNNIQILVENQGRVNFLLAEDFKGILGDVTLNSARIMNWNMTSFPLEHIETAVEDLIINDKIDKNTIMNSMTSGFLKDGPIVYKTEFVWNEPLDTFLDMSGWGKGVVWLNDINLGRYWPGEGPQVTLYVPGVYFNDYPEKNTLIVLELEQTNKNMTVEFVDKPILGHLTLRA